MRKTLLALQCLCVLAFSHAHWDKEDWTLNATFADTAIHTSDRELLVTRNVNLRPNNNKNMMMNAMRRPSGEAREKRRKKAADESTTVSTQSLGRQGVCVIGCTPYVDLRRTDTGVAKYKALVNEMAQTCDVLVHLGDSKPSGMACNRTTVGISVKWMRAAARRHGKIALYAPGDNEINDCHRIYNRPADFYKAADARGFLAKSLKLSDSVIQSRRGRDLTLAYEIENHFDFKSNETVPGTNYGYSCDFDKYVELDHYAVATLEVPGSLWYLQDEGQNSLDPLMDRFGMYLNAMECTVDWIKQSARKASANGKKAVFFMFHAVFYGLHGVAPISQPSSGFYSKTNFARYMRDIAGRSDITDAYGPLFKTLTDVALQYPDLQFYVVNADGHRFQTIRMNPGLINRGGSTTNSNHNLRLHMVEGASKALTMWTRFTVDPETFQSVAIKEEWSKAAFDIQPKGHAWIPY